MKNLPEKIYLQEPTKVRTQKMYDNDIEYIRKDAFIENACEFLKDHLAGYNIYEDDIERSVESFKLAMEL